MFTARLLTADGHATLALILHQTQENNATDVIWFVLLGMVLAGQFIWNCACLHTAGGNFAVGLTGSCSAFQVVSPVQHLVLCPS
jgi:hypothetical protein